ncbi:alpha/beta fold hydrolase [Maribacter sp. 2-571]|uniref:alpha/beta fold hydrolase n=1 Tax=Maribacter sp. 2-571 TaxID=3417569 RepID=UPI003D351C5E
MEQLHSLVLGEGEPMIILHGFLGMSDNWKTLGRHYAENGLQVHLVDQRNHGRSFHSDTFNYDVLSDDLYRYMREKGLSKAIIMGHSMGGKTAMQFACDHPEMTKKLIVADIAPKFYPPHHNSILSALKALDLAAIGSRKEAETALAEQIKEPGIRLFLLKNLYRAEKDRFALRINLDVLGERMNEVGENIGNTDIFEGPTLFIRGGNSEYIDTKDTPQIVRHFPLATVKTIPETGHWLHAENPDAYFTITKHFIES